MKKVMLVAAMVFATSSLVNANTSVNKNTIEKADCCVCDAWDFGTEWGKGDEAEEYYWTDLYYEAFCLQKVIYIRGVKHTPLLFINIIILQQ